MDEQEKKALSDIEKYGCHVLQIMEDETGPRFSYSIGIQKTSNAPELIIIGLKNKISLWIINEYSNRIRNGEKFTENAYYEGFLEGFPVMFKKVEKKHYREYFGWAIWLYKGDNFEALQLVYPTTSGIWPWDPDASPSFIENSVALYKTDLN